MVFALPTTYSEVDEAPRCQMTIKDVTNEILVQASVELAYTYAALILADDGIEITVRRPSIALLFSS